MHTKNVIRIPTYLLNGRMYLKITQPRACCGVFRNHLIAFILSTVTFFTRGKMFKSVLTWKWTTTFKTLSDVTFPVFTTDFQKSSRKRAIFQVAKNSLRREKQIDLWSSVFLKTFFAKLHLHASLKIGPAAKMHKLRAFPDAKAKGKEKIHWFS